MIRGVFQLHIGFILGVCYPLLAAEPDSSEGKSSAAKMPVVDEIIVNVHPVFDENNPDENNWLFRLVNRLHIDTKKHVIEKDLTFKVGDTADKYLLEESERRLRSRRYLTKTTVKALEQDENNPNPENSSGQKVQVDVREVWTLVPKITYSHTGGNTKSGYGLHDSNFLGLGKTVKIEHITTVERTSDLIQYRDYNLWNRNQLIVTYADNSDGKEKELSFSRPFGSIKDPWSGGVDYLNFDREDTLYDAGEEAERFAHSNNYHSFFYGFTLPESTDDKVHRLLVGFDDSKEDFFWAPNVINSDQFELPYDRSYRTLWLEYSYLGNEFVEARNIQQINRVEDINLGSEWRFRIGKVDSDTPQLDQAIQLQLDYSKAFQLSESQVLLSQFSSSGFYTKTQATQSLTQAQLSYHWKNFSRGQLFILANQGYGKNLFVDTPLELGGDTGLRGYTARFQAGSKLQQLTVEQRYYGQKEWLSLFHLGAAVFYDQGRVWGESAVPQTYTKTLRDVGIGLRISGTRTGGQDEGVHNVAHIDLSFPLDTGPGIDKYLWSVHIKSGF